MNYQKEARRLLLHYFTLVKPDLDSECSFEIELIVDNIIRAAVEEARNLTERHLDQDHPSILERLQNLEEQVASLPQNYPSPWACLDCGHLNKAGMHYCEFCKKLDEEDEAQLEEIAGAAAEWKAMDKKELEGADVEGELDWEAQPETVGFEDTAGNIISWLLNMYVAHDAWEGGNEAQLLLETAIEKLNDAHELYTPQPEEPEPTPPINPFRHLNNQQLIDIIRKIPDYGENSEAKAIIQQEWAMTRDLVADHLARCQFSHLVEFIGLAAPHMEFDIYNFRSRLAEILDLVEELKGLESVGTCWGDIVTAEKKQEAEWKKNNPPMHY